MNIPKLHLWLSHIIWVEASIGVIVLGLYLRPYETIDEYGSIPAFSYLIIIGLAGIMMACASIIHSLLPPAGMPEYP